MPSDINFPDYMTDGDAQGGDIRSIESDGHHRDWLTEPERATGLLALVLFIGGFLTLAATVGGLGWLIATAIKATGWDG